MEWGAENKPEWARCVRVSFCSSSLRFPEPVCAGIVPRAALFSEGGWDAFSKTPTASNSVICFRVELHLGAEPTSHSGADSRTAKDLSSTCGGRCSRCDRWRNGNGKSDGNRRILLPSQRSESAGPPPPPPPPPPAPPTPPPPPRLAPTH